MGSVANGGTWVARHDGRVVFVRQALAGELVKAQVLNDAKAKFWRADAVEIIEASPDRVQPPCPIASSCGGCDFQHVAPAVQPKLKAQVIRELLAKFAGIDWDVVVEPVSADCLGWRTRMRYHLANGRLGMHRARSNDIVELGDTGCLIAAEAGRFAAQDYLADNPLAGKHEISVVSSQDQLSILVDGEVASGPKLIKQKVFEREYLVAAGGFWQVHEKAAEVLTQAVLEFIDPAAGAKALDLYCGVGLFGGALADHQMQVWGIEVVADAIELAKRNVPQARFFAGRVDQQLAKLPSQVDRIVLDPPRAGAGREVVEKLAEMGAEKIVYVACDPAALARDLGYFAQHGYVLTNLRAFDLFPMTQHVETVCLLTRQNVKEHLYVDVDMKDLKHEKLPPKPTYKIQG